MSEKTIVDEAENNEITCYVFVKEGYNHFTTQYVTAGATTVEWIFPIPEPNAVGTLDNQNNGIVFIKFGDYGMEPKRRVVAKGYGDNIYDLHYYRFSQNYTDDTIVYSQTRTAVIANVKTGDAFYAGCGLSDYDYLLGIRFLDPKEKLLVLLKSIKGDKLNRDSYLHIAKLEGKDLIDTGCSIYIGETDDSEISPHFPQYNPWYVHDRHLFVYDPKQHKITCTNGPQSLSHPFSEVFNANTNRIGKVKDIAIHPKLPFGAIIEEGASKTHDLIVLRWDITNPKKKNEQIVSFSQVLEPLKPLFGLDRLTLAYPSFSPDGSWYVVGLIGHGERGAPQCTHFVAIPVTPVDKEHPYFLDIDNLVVLGQVAGLTSIAWTFEPVSYVVSNGELLYKWDLDELPNARVFEMPEDGAGERKSSIFGKIARLFGGGSGE
jgi:hypothetical protein